MWKVARVVPIPKGGNTSMLSNYRPISILPVVSKLLESHVKILISNHLNESSESISERQWGFLKSRSTTSALIQVMDDWSKAVDLKHEVAVVFLDVRKAFDSVPHIHY